MKTLLKANIILAIFLLISPASQAFTDHLGHTYEDAIHFVVSEGIVSGYPDDTFQPNRVMNRAELLKIVIEAKFNQEFTTYSNDACFTDVPAGEWFTPYICFAKSQGIVEGYADGSFKPAQEVIFVEALKMSMLAFGYPYSEANPWYSNLIDQAVDYNIIPLGTKTYGEAFSRGKMAELITRLIKYEDGSLNSYLGDLEHYRVTQADLDLGQGTVTTYIVLDLDLDLNEFRSEFLSLINDYRSQNGLDTLGTDPRLHLAAQKHSVWMAETTTLSHTGENGSSHTDRCYAEGTFCLAENAAYQPYTTSAEEFFTAWKNSPGHDANMRLNSINDIGIGIAVGEDGAYATTVFR